MPDSPDSFPLLPDSELDLGVPLAIKLNDAPLETPPGPQADMLLTTPPGINIIEATPLLAPGSRTPTRLGPGHSPLAFSFIPDGKTGESQHALIPGAQVVADPEEMPMSLSRLSVSSGRTSSEVVSGLESPHRLSVSSGRTSSEIVSSLERRRSSLTPSMEFKSVRRKSSTGSSLPSIISRVDRLEDYSFLDNHGLGGGATAQVIPGIFKPTKTPCAIKQLYKEGYNARHVDVRSQWKDEIEMIKMVDRHPNIVRVLDAWEGAKFFNTVMDLALGGDLQTLIDISGPLPEPSAAFLMAVLINTLDYVHTVGILHRDVRPPNILFLTKHHLPSEILLIDFGLSAMLPSDGRPLTEFNLGAPFYTAPELSAPISPGYGPAADFFSAGSCAQFILTGARPGTPFPPKMSEDAVDFITRLRDPDQFSRPTGQKALEHPWIVKNVDVETLIYLKGLNGEVLEGKMLGQRTATFSKREETVVVGTAGQAVPSPAKPEKKGLKKFIAGLFGSK